MKTRTMISGFRSIRCWLLVSCMALLVAVVPAQAQDGTLSLTSEDDIGSGKPITGTDLREWLASNTSIAYSGEEAIQVTLNLVVYEAGRQAKTFTSKARPVGTPVADLLPPEDWFMAGDGRGILSWLADLFSGGRQPDPTNLWDGYSEEDCRSLGSYDARQACLAANGYRGAAEQTGTFMMVMPMPDNPKADISTQGLLLTLNEDE